MVFWAFEKFPRVLVVLGVFWSFSRVLGYFGYLWCILVMLAILRGPFLIFVGSYWFFEILEILTGKIICFDRKKKPSRNH